MNNDEISELLKTPDLYNDQIETRKTCWVGIFIHLFSHIPTFIFMIYLSIIIREQKCNFTNMIMILGLCYIGYYARILYYSGKLLYSGFFILVLFFSMIFCCNLLICQDICF